MKWTASGSAIPSRNVTGFLGGEWNAFGDYLAVTGNDAHSWVEVWFADLGWVPFDPTPSARNALVAEGAVGGWWSAALWFDGLEYRWYKWVIDYDLEKQIGIFSRVSELFSRNDRRGMEGGRGGVGSAPRGVAVGIAAGVRGALLWALRRRRRAPLTEESRAYLALRRACSRAGIGGEGGPLEFAERVVAADAPGAAPAAELVRLYVRARFGAEDIGDVGRARMRQALDEARAELRAAGRKRA